MFKIKNDGDLDPIKELNAWEKVCTYTLGFICLLIIILMFTMVVKLLIPCDYILEDDVSMTNYIISTSSEIN